MLVTVLTRKREPGFDHPAFCIFELKSDIFKGYSFIGAIFGSLIHLDYSGRHQIAINITDIDVV